MTAATATKPRTTHLILVTADHSLRAGFHTNTTSHAGSVRASLGTGRRLSEAAVAYRFFAAKVSQALASPSS